MKQQTTITISEKMALVRRQRRIRTIFSFEQLVLLERAFSQQMYLVGEDRLYLAKQLNLSEDQVKIWFQNRRIKYRKESQRQRREPVLIRQDQNEDCQMRQDLSPSYHDSHHQQQQVETSSHHHLHHHHNHHFHHEHANNSSQQQFHCNQINSDQALNMTIAEQQHDDSSKHNNNNNNGLIQTSHLTREARLHRFKLMVQEHLATDERRPIRNNINVQRSVYEIHERA